MAIKHQLQESLYQILKHNQDGSKGTQAVRKHTLYQMATDLVQGGYKLKHIQGLKQKHVHYLYDQWKANGISNATMKNRTAHLRWVCEKLNKANVVPTNDQLGIGKRQYINNTVNKAVDLNKVDLTKITNPYVQVQIHLQRYLGLRREECIKIRPYQADKETHIELKASWCKGGRARNVPVIMQEARYWLNEAKKLVSDPTHSLIPAHKQYVQHRRNYDQQVQRAGIKHPHGLRHAYAQDRYKMLTGWECPKRGGLTAKELTPEQRALDHEARLIISGELGHHRESVVGIYIGK